MRRHGVGSRFPLKMEPGADGCDSGKMTVAFSLAWLKPRLVLLQTCLDLCHEVRGPCVSAGGKPANDRPSPHSVLVQTSTRPSAAPGCHAGFSGHRAGFRRQPATAGPLPFKAKEFVHMLFEHGTVLVLRRALQAPEVMLDDAVQARPGRFRLQRLRRALKVAVPLRPGTYIPYGTTAEGYP